MLIESLARTVSSAGVYKKRPAWIWLPCAENLLCSRHFSSVEPPSSPCSWQWLRFLTDGCGNLETWFGLGEFPQNMSQQDSFISGFLDFKALILFCFKDFCVSKCNFEKKFKKKDISESKIYISNLASLWVLDYIIDIALAISKAPGNFSCPRP